MKFSLEPDPNYHNSPYKRIQIGPEGWKKPEPPYIEEMGPSAALKRFDDERIWNLVKQAATGNSGTSKPSQSPDVDKSYPKTHHDLSDPEPPNDYTLTPKPSWAEALIDFAKNGGPK